jgi:hypothetical protein
MKGHFRGEFGAHMPRDGQTTPGGSTALQTWVFLLRSPWRV